jgi:hypothetical protein
MIVSVITATTSLAPFEGVHQLYNATSRRISLPLHSTNPTG